ncbi:MAG: T9SS type A sorting domain-containing protein [Tenacibaculum sp.]
MKIKLLHTLSLILISYLVTAQNLLDTSTWTVGSDSVLGFKQNGKTSENSREWGKNHLGSQVILWKATPDANRDADGGWNSQWHNADHNRSYRFSVWLKKTNSNDGYSYFGFYANNSGSLTLSGTFNKNPYFWHGDLPRLNRWYLLVGYVHKSSHTGTSHTGGIYDGTTGKKVKSTTDFKLKNTVSALKHRSYLYYDTNTSDRQYFYSPRIDPINGSEPTIKELLEVNTNSKLIVSYDTASNQSQQFYCENPSYCSPSIRKPKEDHESVTALSEEEDKNTAKKAKEQKTEHKDLSTYLSIRPNPTSGYVVLYLDDKLLKEIHTVQLYNANSVLLQNIKATDNTIALDLSNKPYGVYFVHIHIKGGTGFTKKIIKY